MKFLDQAKIYIASGHGGPGSISFRREKHMFPLVGQMAAMVAEGAM